MHDNTEGLKKYRHLVAAMIEESIGYFTPRMALEAVECHKAKEDYGCEWYYDILFKRHRGMKWDEIPKDAFREINRDVIRSAVRRRHSGGYRHCLGIVDRNIAGNESIGASWF